MADHSQARQFEAGHDGFNLTSSWPTPPSTDVSSFQSDFAFRSRHSSERTSQVNDSHNSQMPNTECTNGIGSWMDGMTLAHHTQFQPKFFDQDFVLFGSQDSVLSLDWPQETTHAQSYNTFAAPEEARAMLAPFNNISPLSSQDIHQPPSKKAKRTHSISRGPPRKTSVRPRLPCGTTGCNKTFSRASDLDRHVRNIHGESSGYYECSSHRCLYRTRRKDKMQEHCQKVHAYTRGSEVYATVEEGDAFTPLSFTTDE